MEILEQQCLELRRELSRANTRAMDAENRATDFESRFINSEKSLVSTRSQMADLWLKLSEMQQKTFDCDSVEGKLRDTEAELARCVTKLLAAEETAKKFEVIAKRHEAAANESQSLLLEVQRLTVCETEFQEKSHKLLEADIRVRSLEHQLQSITQERDQYLREIQTNQIIFEEIKNLNYSERTKTYEDEIKELKLKLIDAQKSLSHHEKLNKELTDSLHQSVRNSEEFNYQNNLLELKLKKYKEIEHKLQSTEETLRITEDLFKERLEKSKQYKQSFKDTESRLIETQHQLQDTEQKLRDCTSQFTALSQEAAANNRRLAEYEDKEREYVRQLEVLARTMGQLMSHESANKQDSQKVAQLELSLHESQSQQQELKKLVTEAEGRLAEREVQISALETSLKQSQERLADLDKEKTELKAQLVGTKDCAKDLEEELLRSDAEVQSKQRQIVELEERLQTSHDTLVETSTLLTQSNHLHEVESQFQACKHELREYEKMFKDKDSRISQLQDQLLTANKLQVSTDARLFSLEEHLKEVVTNWERSQEAQLQQRDLGECLRASEEQRRLLEGRVAAKGVQLEGMSRELRDMESGLKETQKQLEEHIAIILDKQAEIDRLEAVVREHRDESAALAAMAVRAREAEENLSYTQDSLIAIDRNKQELEGRLGEYQHVLRDCYRLLASYLDPDDRQGSEGAGGDMSVSAQDPGDESMLFLSRLRKIVGSFPVDEKIDSHADNTVHSNGHINSGSLSPGSERRKRAVLGSTEYQTLLNDLDKLKTQVAVLENRGALKDRQLALLKNELAEARQELDMHPGKAKEGDSVEDDATATAVAAERVGEGSGTGMNGSHSSTSNGDLNSSMTTDASTLNGSSRGSPNMFNSSATENLSLSELLEVVKEAEGTIASLQEQLYEAQVTIQSQEQEVNKLRKKVEVLRKVSWSVGGVNVDDHILELTEQLQQAEAELTDARLQMQEYEVALSRARAWTPVLNPLAEADEESDVSDNDEEDLKRRRSAEEEEFVMRSELYSRLEKELLRVRRELAQEHEWRLEAEDTAVTLNEKVMRAGIQ